MTANHSSTSVDQESPVVPLDAGQKNLELAQALHEVAHWIELHAGDLPTFSAYLSCSEYSDRARDVLTAVAGALGDRAEEGVDGMDCVEIRGTFGAVRLRAYAPLKYVGGEEQPKPAPKYEPILQVPPVTAEEDEAWRERGWRVSEDAS